MKKELLDNINKIHTTILGEMRIKKNLGINEDVVKYCINIINNPLSKVIKKGKNYYVYYEKNIFTINSYSFTIITAHKKNDF